MFVFFMTDGCDTCNNEHSILHAKEKLQETIAKYGEEVIVNVLGFSQHHDDAFLESLTTLGTADGSYNYIRPEDGDVALQQRLTDLLEATTGLVGKSVYLDLKILAPETSNAAFLGDWFGPGEKDIAIQAFMKVNKDGKAGLKTTKFMRLPKNEKLRKFDLKIEISRDLQDETVKLPGKLVAVEYKTQAATNDELALRKIRASLNMLTGKISNTVEDAGGADKVEQELKSLEEWFKVVKASSEKAKVAQLQKKQDSEEVAKLADAVQNGLRICETALMRDQGEDYVSHGKRMRNVKASYDLGTKQQYNQLQVKSKAAPRGNVNRSQLQQKQRYMD